MEFAGISLQIAAGLVFVLDQVAHKFSTSVEKWVGGVITRIPQRGKRRWRILTLFSLVALPVMIIALTTWGPNGELTWTTIGGVLVFTVIGFDAYVLLLVLIRKRNLRDDIGEHISSLLQDEKLISLNVKAFFISCVVTVSISLVAAYVYPKLDYFVLRIILTLVLACCTLVFVPALFFSFLFLLVEGLLRFISVMGKVKSGYYWIAVLVLWIAGGGFLLANALRG
jgi:hypothetical protein